MTTRLTIALFPAIGMLASSVCLGQLHNASNLYIDGVSVHVDGDVINNGRLDNLGWLAFNGDWKNDGYYAGSGTVEANGNTPQVIAHRGQRMSQLVIKGWGTKYIRGMLQIEEALSLQRGIVEVREAGKLVLEADAAATGGSPESYIDGALCVEGGGYKFFPLGKNGTYAPIEFLDVRHYSKFAVEVFEDAPVVTSENTVIRHSFYWRRTDLAGHFGGSRIGIAYERDHFQDPANVILLVANTFEETFAAVTGLEHSTETGKITTLNPVSATIIMIGERSSRWSDADFYLSTALSPHAFHAENKYVKVFGDRLSADAFHFQVFDRWGDLVFESRSLEDMKRNGWNGRTVGGVELATGTYPYRLSAYDKLGNAFEKRGVITLVH